jgi:pimeloyl-ACP methyl ester carboxylesterase
MAAPAMESVPKAVIADPPPDAKFPARMEVIHVPSGKVQINGVVYVASGERPHPAFVFFHGLPGNEKNLDLAQAVRRAGWTVITVNYRGSWGSPGNFRFAQNLEDAAATLSFIRSPENAKRLSIGASRVALGGHSMGGWVTAETLAHDSNLLGAVIISAGDFGAIGLRAQQNRDGVIAAMNDNRESLAGATGGSGTTPKGGNIVRDPYSLIFAVKPIPRRLGSGSFIRLRIASNTTLNCRSYLFSSATSL